MNTPTARSEIRCIQYSCIIGEEPQDRFGFFEVDFDAKDQPIRADMLGFVGYRDEREAREAPIGKAATDMRVGFGQPAGLVEFLENLEHALYTLPTIVYTYRAVDLDNENWDGRLYFPRPITAR